ncbi:DUF3754 domain-containing protein [Paraliomyxa miuraensis]|uniref:DUF3754 domain-containing protein n=1 Tax=Paraliomyxa miuraensis TaxID=376150 RepID=UPI00225B9567|nr:DUF3754 domain-containing protein [Paraliomyxa miuraensis]MCX4247745.1 TMEM143 family protein [Paraliomyxa miuraensis]
MALAPARRVPPPAARLGMHLPDDRYVPLRADDLVAALAEDAERFGLRSSQVRAVAEALDRVVAQETEELRRGLERAYHPFNPARDTLLLGNEDERAERARRARGLIAYVLDKANFEALDSTQVQAAVGAANSHGIRIRVRPERVEWIELWVRGRTIGKRAVRTLRRPIAGEEHEIELYRRLAVVFQSKEDDSLNLKLFREIPVADVEALLPHAEVAMSGFDRLKVLGGSMGALGGLATQLLESTVVAGHLLWVGVAALGGLSVRSVLGYRRAKLSRLSQMTHHLYYQNVANNAGVLDQLVASIGQEDLKEAVLAYTIVHGGATSDETSLRKEVAGWLRERFEVEVDFDGPDAVATLARLGLWADRNAWTVCPTEAAVEQLQRAWQERRTAGHHLRATDERKG